MSEGFNRVLVLIDFSPASLHTVEEAAKIAGKFNSDLYLLHVSSSLSGLLFPELYPFEIPGGEKENMRINKFRLEKTKIDLENRFGISIKTYVTKGSLKETVYSYSQELQIDLVVVNANRKTGFKEFLFGGTAETIINTVDSEVLCVYPESDCSHVKKIVLPVGRFVPKRKIKVAYELARKFAASIHLVSLNNSASKKLAAENTKALLDTFRYLKDITNIPVECKTVSGPTIAEATVNYAKAIGADLILVNPGAESYWSENLLRRWGNDIVSRSSIPVLSVQSILNKTKPVLYTV